jgi:hypothetical protein
MVEARREGGGCEMYFLLVLVALTGLSALGGLVRALVKLLAGLMAMAFVTALAIILLLAFASHGKLI